MNVTNTTYVPGQGSLGYLPGYEEPVARGGGGFQAQVKEQTAQQAADKTEREPAFKGPGLYDPEALESFERRELDKDTLEELAAKLLKKYNPTHMTQEEYDSFLEDMVEEGILSKYELGVLGYHGIIEGDMPCCGATTLDTKNPNWDTYFSRYGYANSLEEFGGNTLAYTVMQVLWSKDPVGTSGFVKRVETQANAYSAMAKVLEAMDRQCGSTTADTKNPNWDARFGRQGYAKTLQGIDGNTLAYALLQALRTKDPVESSQFVKQVEAQTSAFSAMETLLEAMDHQR